MFDQRKYSLYELIVSCNCNYPKPSFPGLEVDQFTWSILQTPRFSDCDSVAIDSRAHVAPVHGAGSGGPKSGPGSDESVSPQALKPPNLAMWGELGGGGG